MAMILPDPMLLHQGRKTHPFGRSDFIYEIKYDGYRMLAGVQDGQVQLATRGGHSATQWFPEIARGLAQLPSGMHVLDGEVCVLNDQGVSDFHRMQKRASHRRWYPGCDPVVFCAFDLLAYNGRSLIALPVEQRKSLLQELLSGKPPSVLYVGHFDSEHGAELYAHACAWKLEGLVAKRLGSPYLPGERSPDWVKCKVPGAVKPGRFKR